MVTPGFRFLRTPRLVFQSGALMTLPQFPEVRSATQVLLVTGARSLEASGNLEALLRLLGADGRRVFHETVSGEPSPHQVDALCGTHRGHGIDLVIAVGGGSALDLGKALAAMLPLEDSVQRYLEGVGNRPHPGCRLPLIAIPTTSGTGSEATSNAVLSQVGPQGYKRSLRHDSLVPDVAVLDPCLTVHCPPAVTAASGLDAFTQLLEAYVSTAATPLSDALALSGLTQMASALVPACTGRGQDEVLRGALAYGAYLSGIVLANAGLGLVHGFASPIGGMFPVPHGVVCGTLQGEVVKTNLRLLREAGPTGAAALSKYAAVGRIVSGMECAPQEPSLTALTETLDSWIERLEIPRLGTYGIAEEHLDSLVAQTGNKNNPVSVPADEMRRILSRRL